MRAACLTASRPGVARSRASRSQPIPPSAAAMLIALYEGALFTLLTAPAGHATEDAARALARAMVHGALPDWPEPPKLGRHG